MNQDKDKESAIREVFQAIICFIDHYENQWPVAKNSEESVHLIFQQSLFLETAYQNMKAHGSIAEFSKLFNTWLLKNKNINPWYKYDFFQASSDRMLERFIHDETMPRVLVQKAKEVYISVCSQERFDNLSKEMVEADKTMKDLLRIQAKINGSENVKMVPLDSVSFLFHEILYLQESGNGAKLYEIVAALMCCKSSETLEILLRILTLNVVTGDAHDKQANTKELVLQLMLKNLHKHNKVRTKFWRNCCNVNQDLLSEVASVHFPFFIAMRDYIQWCGDVLKLTFTYVEGENGSFISRWENPENSLGYDMLVRLIQCLLISNRKPQNNIKLLLSNNAKLREKDPNVWIDLSMYFKVIDLNNM